jgi:uncharacterized protein (TIGR02246 family)
MMLKAGIAIGLMLIAVGTPSMAKDDALAVVTQLDAQFDKAWNTLDAHKLAEQYTTDTIILPPTAPAGTGTKAVVAIFEPLFKNKWSDHKLEPITAHQVSDRTIVAASHWSARLTDANGQATRYHGDVAQVFEKSGNDWKIKLASWNVLTDAK